MIDTPVRELRSVARAADAAALRIGIYSSSLAHSAPKPGGVDVFVDRLAERLAHRGHQVVVLTYSPPAASRSYELRQLEPRSTATSRLRRMFAAPLRLNWIDTVGLDVLHLHGDDWFYLRRRVPTVRTFHGSALFEARHAARTRRRVSQYVTYGLELAAARLATSSYGVIPGDGAGPPTIGHLSLAVDLPNLDGCKRADAPTVLFVGTWAGRKRGQMLHDLFRRAVLPRVPEARLVMVSDHCEPGPNIEWVRRPSDDELIELYRSAWLFCLPSSYEGFGLPYIEAMAQGTPVVAADNPGARFVLDHGRYGIVAGDGELAQHITALLLDERSRIGLAEAGRLRAADFGWDRVLDRHERAYRDAIAAFSCGDRRPVARAA